MIKFKYSKILFLFSALPILFIGCSSNTNKTKMPEESVNTIAFDTAIMKHHIDPCVDFYNYSIGGWRDRNQVPKTESRWMSFNILDKENKKKLQVILDETIEANNVKEGSPKQQIRDLYLSSKDNLAIEQAGLTPIKVLLDKINNIQTVSDMNNVLTELRPLGLGGPYGIYIGKDAKNSNKYIVSASQSGLSLPDKEYYLRTDEKSRKIKDAYIEHINSMFKLAKIKDYAGVEILALETKLAEVSWDRTKMRVPENTYNKMSLKQWDSELKSINVSSILNTWGLKNIDTLVVRTPSYFSALDQLLVSIPLKDWKSYLNWKLISSFSSYLGDDFEKEHFNFYSKTLSGTKEMRPKKERLLRMVDGQMGFQLGKLFVEKHFPESSKTYISEMIENLRSAYKESINNLAWMSDETKVKALKKLNSFKYKVGYPSKWKDYSSIKIDPKTYIQNIINIRDYGFNEMIARYGKPVDKDEWHMKPQMVNAYYSSSNNEIVFPAGILQPPFFSPQNDDAINYGGIGGVIGHEFTHGFDDQGSKYDWDGNLNNWWTPQDRERFEALTQQLSAQYSAYEALPGKFVKGDMTLGENIADLGGVTLGFEALKKQLNGTNPDLIDGFTWQQRFFLGWANVWKGNITDKELEKRLITDYHSPAPFRVIGPFSNSIEFHKAYGCENAADTMIKIW